MQTFFNPTADDRPVTASPDARASWRTWGDETVVHHALSNDSHRLAEPAGALLKILSEGGPATPARLAASQGLDPEDLDALLRTLIDLNLVVQC